MLYAVHPIILDRIVLYVSYLYRYSQSWIVGVSLRLGMPPFPGDTRCPVYSRRSNEVDSLPDSDSKHAPLGSTKTVKNIHTMSFAMLCSAHTRNLALPLYWNTPSNLVPPKVVRLWSFVLTFTLQGLPVSITAI